MTRPTQLIFDARDRIATPNTLAPPATGSWSADDLAMINRARDRGDHSTADMLIQAGIDRARRRPTTTTTTTPPAPPRKPTTPTTKPTDRLRLRDRERASMAAMRSRFANAHKNKGIA